jgi:ATP-dependent Lon protease
VVSDELDKLSGLEPVSPEFNVTRTYLEWLTSLPWGVFTQEIFDIQHAQQVGEEAAVTVQPGEECMWVQCAAVRRLTYHMRSSCRLR